MNIKDILNDEKKVTGSFTQGFMSSFNAFKVISEHKGLKKYFVIPFILNLVILCAIFLLAFFSIYPWLSSFLQGDTWYLTAMRVILVPVLMLALGIIVVMLYSILGNIITAPFNDFISLRVEEALTGEDFDEELSFAAIIDDIFRVIANIVKFILILIVIEVILLILNVLPVVGSLLYSVISFLSTAFFLGFQFFDFPLERRRLKFGDKFKICWRYKFMVIGLGTGFFLMSFIPIVGFLGLNLSSVGATTLFIDHIKPVMKLTADKQKGQIEG